MDREVVYHFGATGTGKTYAAAVARLDEHPDLCFLGPFRTAFDDYYQEEHVVIDMLAGTNYGKADIDYSLLLKLVSRKNIMLDTRYYKTFWCPKTIHITSIFAPEDLYKQFNSVDDASELIQKFTKLVYHYIEDDEYKELVLTPEEYLYKWREIRPFIDRTRASSLASPPIFK